MPEQQAGARLQSGDVRTVWMAARASPSFSRMLFKPTPPRLCSLNWSMLTLFPSPYNAPSSSAMV